MQVGLFCINYLHDHHAHEEKVTVELVNNMHLLRK